MVLKRFLTQPVDEGRRAFLLKALSGIVGVSLYHLNQLGTVVYYLTHGDRQSNQVALTFDDGWTEEPIQRLIEICEEYQIKTSVFAIGLQFDDFPAVWKTLYAHGHPIFNHTLTHGNFGLKLYERKMEKQILGWEEYYNRFLNLPEPELKLLRPPGLAGVERPELYEWLSRYQYRAIVGASLNPEDWHPAVSKERVLSEVTENLQGGDIVLLHLIEKTMDVLPQIIESGLERGLEFVRLTELSGTPWASNNLGAQSMGAVLEELRAEKKKYFPE
jgi:peptidoglycan/xylan/chitin deacetylase (PgdA/CDA1 family)